MKVLNIDFVTYGNDNIVISASTQPNPTRSIGRLKCFFFMFKQILRSPVASQEIGREERLRNDPFFVGWDQPNPIHGRT